MWPSPEAFVSGVQHVSTPLTKTLTHLHPVSCYVVTLEFKESHRCHGVCHHGCKQAKKLHLDFCSTTHALLCMLYCQLAYLAHLPLSTLRLLSALGKLHAA
ncbi:hypothetical protein HYQ46_011201 [Verticillium longisporum]|nr:hypothetical protein HYQ46_011201 [Verticillium longisporum]